MDNKNKTMKQTVVGFLRYKYRTILSGVTINISQAMQLADAFNEAEEMENQLERSYSEEDMLTAMGYASAIDNNMDSETKLGLCTDFIKQLKNKEEPIQGILENLENQLKKVIKENPIDVNEDTYWRGVKNGLKVAIEVIKFKLW